MVKAAPSLTPPEEGRRRWEYEQPLSERMRTFMRLEFLYQQLLYHGEQESDWATRAAVSGLLDILALLSRGDCRTDVLKELDRQLETLDRFSAQPNVDTSRLDSLLGNIRSLRSDLQAIGTGYLQPIKDNEFLSAIKHRSSIPGGTCEFDLPEYSHWLRQPFDRRNADLMRWVSAVRPVCDAVVEALWLVREFAQSSSRLAINGMYQHAMSKDSPCQLLRITLPSGSPWFPEISGNQQRFTVRFLEWSSIDKRALQTSRDISFRLGIS